MAKSSGGVRNEKSNPNQRIQRIIAKFESRIKDDKKETLYVVGSRGDILAEEKGSKDQVVIPRSAMKLIKNNVVIHNHPSATKRRGIERIGQSFSLADIHTAVTGDAKEMRAVTTTYVFSLKRPKKGWGNFKEIHKEYQQAEKEVYAKLSKYIRWYKGDKDTAYARANVLHFNLITKKVAKKFGWKYSHKKHNYGK